MNRVKNVKNSYTVNGDNRTGNKAAAVLVDIGLITDLVDSHGNNNDQELSAPTKTTIIKPKRYVRAANANRNFNSGSSRKVRLPRDDDDDDDEDIPMLNPNYDPTNVDYAEEHVDHSDTNKIVAKNDETCNLNSSSSSLDDHCHVSVNIENKNRNRVVWYKLITVLILCLIFMVGEIVGGILAKSISIQTDAAHMAADIAGFFFSIVAIYVSEKGISKFSLSTYGPICFNRVSNRMLCEKKITRINKLFGGGRLTNAFHMKFIDFSIKKSNCPPTE